MYYVYIYIYIYIYIYTYICLCLSLFRFFGRGLTNAVGMVISWLDTNEDDEVGLGKNTHLRGEGGHCGGGKNLEKYRRGS